MPYSNTNKYVALKQMGAAGILVILLAAAWFLAAKPYIGLLQDRLRQAENLQRKQTALRQIIAAQEHYQQQLRATSESREFSGLFLDDKNGALAEAKLQRMINDIVNQSGAKLMQAVISRPAAGTTGEVNEAGRSDSVTIRVMMQGSIESIYTALHALENGRPLVAIDRLQIVHQKSRKPVSPQVSATSYRASYHATAFIL